MAGLTLDSGALIAVERGKRIVFAHLKEAQSRGIELTVPSIVVAEVWRGGARSARVGALLGACVIAPVDESMAREAGEALARVPGAGAIDAVVMVSAARRRDNVLTSDFDDLDRLRSQFPAVRLIRI